MDTHGGVDDVVIRPSDLLIDNPVRIDALSKGDVVLLAVYGESKVMGTPFFDPAHNREYVTLLLMTKRGMKKLICTRNKCFQYVRFVLD